MDGNKLNMDFQKATKKEAKEMGDVKEEDKMMLRLEALIDKGEVGP